MPRSKNLVFEHNARIKINYYSVLSKNHSLHLIRISYLTVVSILSQNVIFYVLSDDVSHAKKKLSNANINNTFNIVYPGNADTSVPGKL